MVQVIDEYDEQSEVADRLRIKIVPLFHFYKDGELVESFATRDKERIIATPHLLICFELTRYHHIFIF